MPSHYSYCHHPRVHRILSSRVPGRERFLRQAMRKESVKQTDRQGTARQPTTCSIPSTILQHTIQGLRARIGNSMHLVQEFLLADILRLTIIGHQENNTSLSLASDIKATTTFPLPSSSSKPSRYRHDGLPNTCSADTEYPWMTLLKSRSHAYANAT